jgi:hypothetical protein
VRQNSIPVIADDQNYLYQTDDKRNYKYRLHADSSIENPSSLTSNKCTLFSNSNFKIGDFKRVITDPSQNYRSKIPKPNPDKADSLSNLLNKENLTLNLTNSNQTDNSYYIKSN